LRSAKKGDLIEKWFHLRGCGLEQCSEKTIAAITLP
jgi:sarcosine oxidase delta subunit